jgi:hypothetical protein
VVIGRGRAARAQQRREPGTRRRALDPRVDPRPRRIQLDQPLEERGVLGEPTRRPLVEVVVAVDQPRRGEAARAVDPRTVERRLAGTDGRDPVALDDDVPVPVDGAADGGDRAALDDHEAASRTASRIFS